MATRHELYEQMVRDREGEAMEADRANRRANVLTAAVCLFWCALGGAVLAWGLMGNHADASRTALRAGAELSTAGTLFTLLYAYRKAEKRGDR